jgi:hypothetical protein
VLRANRLRFGGRKRNTTRRLQAPRDVRVQRLAILVDIVDDGQRLAESDRRHPLANDVERRAFLADDGHALASPERFGDEVDDDLALAGPGGAVDTVAPWRRASAITDRCEGSAGITGAQSSPLVETAPTGAWARLAGKSVLAAASRAVTSASGLARSWSKPS